MTTSSFRGPYEHPYPSPEAEASHPFAELDFARRDRRMTPTNPTIANRDPNGSQSVSAAPEHVQAILDRLQGVRQYGPRTWGAHCPVGDMHNRGDRDASLSILLTDDRDRATFKCNASPGCDQDTVRRAMDLTVADLFPAWTRRQHQASEHLDYPYHDNQGTLRYVIRRQVGAAHGGRFHWRHPDPSTGELERGSPPDDPQRFLYRLPQMLREDAMNPPERLWPVYITEGERDANRLAERCGLLTTTVASGSWANVDTSPLAGREVVVVVDNDRRGWQRGQAFADVAVDAGATLVDTLRPPWRFRDVSDVLAAGLDCDALEPVNLHTEQPPTSWPEDERPNRIRLHRDTGLPFFVKAPAAVMLALLQSGALLPLDVLVWEPLEDRRFTDTNEANATAVDLAADLDCAPRTIRAALRRLEGVSLVRNVRRGRWLVMNPAEQGRAGHIDLPALLTPPPERKPLSPFVNPSTPGNRHPDALSGGADVVSDSGTGIPMHFRGDEGVDR